MKKFSTILFILTLFACSCQKEPCESGTIKITNMGDVAATIYSIDSQPSLLPGESVNQTIEFCTSSNIDRDGCSDMLQIPITFKFDNEEMQDKGILVYRCQTTLLEISN